MTRNLKALGLALVAALAVSAASSPVASAEGFVFLAETAEATLTGAQHSEADELTTTAATVSCNQATYSGTHSEAESAEEFETTKVELSPTYSECTASGVSASYEMNGCKYRFTTGTIESEDLEGSLDIVCPEGKEIEVKTSLFGTTKCTIKVPAQNGLEDVTFENVDKGTEGEVTISVNVENGVQYTHTAGTGFGACSSGSSSQGDYTGALLLEGEEPTEEVPVAVMAMRTKHGTIGPSPIVIVGGANGDRSAFLFITQPGKYKVWEQFLEIGTKFKMEKKADEGRCAGTFEVPQDTKSCYFTVRGTGASIGDEDTLVTKWNVSTALNPLVIKTHVTR